MSAHLDAWRNKLKPEHRYEFKVILPRHPDTVMKRDPRRVWMYDAQLEKTAAEDELYGLSATNNRVYWFAREADATMFILRWGGEVYNDKY